MVNSFVYITDVRVQSTVMEDLLCQAQWQIVYTYSLKEKKYPRSRCYYPILQIRQWNLREAKSFCKVMRLVSSRTRSKCTFMFSRFLTEGEKNYIFNKWYWNNWISVRIKGNPGLYLTLYTKIPLK